MNLYKKLLNISTILYVTLYPILPSYGILSSDLILYLLFSVQFLGFIILKNERLKTLKSIPLLLNDKIFITLFLLNLLMYFSVIFAEDKRVSIVNSIRFTMYIFVYYSIAYKVEIKKDSRILIYSFLSISVISGFISIFQVIKLNFSSLHLDEENRIVSFLENPNNLGAYSVMALFILLLLFLNEKNKKFKYIFLVSSLLLVANIILSQSRNALLALIIGCVLTAIIYDKRFLIASVAIPIILMIIPQSRARLFDILSPDQNSSRIKIWKATELMIKDNPYFGIGYENYSVRYPNYIYHNQDLMVHGSYKALHPHNIFLKIQVELGILGSIVFLLFLLLTIYTLYKYITNANNSFNKSVLIGITISFITFQSMNLIDCYYSSLKVIITMFIMLAISTQINSLKIKSWRH